MECGINCIFIAVRASLPLFSASPVLLLNFLNTSIPLIFTQTDKPGTFYISDFFKDEAYKIVHLIDGDVKPTSRFNILTPENLLDIGNVDYEEITSSYIQYSEEPYCFSEANAMLLKMILAYDKSGDLRKDILYNAEKFAVVIHQEIAKEEEKIISHMNLLQIKKRINTFLPEKEQDWLISVAEGIVLDDKNLEYAYRFGANLLIINGQQNIIMKKCRRNLKMNIKSFQFIDSLQ